MYESGLADRYVKALVTEINGFAGGTAEEMDTIYFGGGTPSLLSPVQVRKDSDRSS